MDDQKTDYITCSSCCQAAVDTIRYPGLRSKQDGIYIVENKCDKCHQSCDVMHFSVYLNAQARNMLCKACVWESSTNTRTMELITWASTEIVELIGDRPLTKEVQNSIDDLLYGRFFPRTSDGSRLWKVYGRHSKNQLILAHYIGVMNWWYIAGHNHVSLDHCSQFINEGIHKYENG